MPMLYKKVHHARAIELADINVGDRVLEVASGTGRATVQLARMVAPSGRLDAVDPDPSRLIKARRQAQAAGLSGYVHLQTGCPQLLPYPDLTFDVLYNAHIFDLVPIGNLVGTLKEFRRVLKLGGKLVLVNLSKTSSEPACAVPLHERGLSHIRRPVNIARFLQDAGFEPVERTFLRNYLFGIPLPFGTEIILARNPEVPTSRDRSLGVRHVVQRAYQMDFALAPAQHAWR